MLRLTADHKKKVLTAFQVIAVRAVRIECNDMIIMWL